MADIQKVRVGDVMAFTHWGKVLEVETHELFPEVVIEDLHSGSRIVVRGAELIEVSGSADRYTNEERVTKTAAAEKLLASNNKPLSVCFTKQDGSERVLRGRLLSAEPLLGRSILEDLDVERGAHRLRQVDHRTIKWLIVDNIKYTVK